MPMGSCRSWKKGGYVYLIHAAFLSGIKIHDETFDLSNPHVADQIVGKARI